MKKFSLEANGYNRTEVNEFIKEVAYQSEKMLEKVSKQEKQIQRLEKEIDHYKEFEENLKKTIIEETNEKIITEAKADASRIVNDALKRAEQIDSEKKLLERNIKLFKKKLNLLLEQQKIIVDKIDELEIEE